MAKLSDLTKQLEAAVDAVAGKKEALDAARASLAKAEGDYQGVVDSVRKLHADYQAIMKDILSFGGTVHTS
jgi:hypothetical protein